MRSPPAGDRLTAALLSDRSSGRKSCGRWAGCHPRADRRVAEPADRIRGVEGDPAGLTGVVKKCRNSCRLPCWQFEPAIWYAIPHLVAAFDTKQSWLLMNFLESPSGALNGRSPRQAIEQGDLREVLRVGMDKSH